MSVFIVDKFRHWPGGILPYEIGADFPVGDPNRVVIEDAISHWNDKTLLKLVSRKPSHKNYIVFIEREDGRCSSPVGLQGEVRQEIGCDISDGFGVGSIIHEIGHAIGLFHEHQRSDRDDFLEYFPRRVNSGISDDRRRANFEKKNIDLPVGGYDYDSIMHYSKCAFSANARRCDPDDRTLVAPQPIGQREGLSQGDILGVNLLYGPRSSGFFIQTRSLERSRGDFEIILPNKGKGIQHSSRLNRLPKDEIDSWRKRNVIEADESYDALAVCQSNYGIGHNLEIAAVQADKIYHIYSGHYDKKDYHWQDRREIMSNVSGTPSIIQSMFGERGDFVVTCPERREGILCTFRKNDDADDSWTAPEHFGRSLGPVVSTAVVNSTIAPDNIELVAVTGAGALVHLYRTSEGWTGPTRTIGRGDYVGSAGFVQSRFGLNGYFEVAVASGSGGIEIWRRDNDLAEQPWNHLHTIRVGGRVFSAISMIHGNYDNLEIMATSDGEVFHFFGKEQTWVTHRINPASGVGI